jgi:hypothetical protein
MLATKIAASIGTSAGRNGRKPGLGNACPIASKHSEQSQGQHDRGNDQRPFDEDVVAPVLWERRIGLSPSRDLPGGYRFSVRILAVLDGDAHGGKFVANAIGLLEVLSRARRCALRNQAIDLLRIDAALLLLASLPGRGAHREEAEQPERGGKLAALMVAADAAALRRTVQDSHSLRGVEVVIERLDIAGDG